MGTHLLTGGPGRSRSRRAGILLAALALPALVSCGDDDDAASDDDADSTEATDGDTTDTTAPFQANICDDVPEADSAAINEGGVIGLIDFEFCDGDISIDAGDSVRFVNYGATDHQVNHEPPGEQEREFRSELMLPGEEFIHTFSEPGTYPYICTIHFDVMTGTITVQ
jgi:plastocyanin